MTQGTAEVVCPKKEDAMAAIRRYNNVQLDGKSMKIEFIGTNVEVPPLPPVLPTPPPLLQSPLPPFAMNWNPVLLNGMPKKYRNLLRKVNWFGDLSKRRMLGGRLSEELTSDQEKRDLAGKEAIAGEIGKGARREIGE